MRYYTSVVKCKILNFPDRNARSVLTLIEKQDNLLECLEEVHVVIAELLDLVDQCELGLCVGGERGEEGHVLLQMAEGLLLEQVLFLVPLHGTHDACPELREKIIHTIYYSAV